MNKFDMDEMLIKNALGSVETPEFDILKGVEAKMNTNPIKTKRLAKGVVIGLIAATLMVMTVAAAQITGSFERLTQIVGTERAEVLTPVELTKVESDIHIEVVAIKVYDKYVDVYFTLEDLSSQNRLREDFRLSHSIWPINLPDGPEEAHWVATSDGGQIIDRDANGIVTMRTRTEFFTQVPTEDLEFSFTTWDITFDVVSYNHYPFAINLASFANNDVPTMLFQYAYPGMSGNAEHPVMESMDLIQGAGLPVLAPQNLNIGLGIDRIDTTISAIGILGDRLHIQTFNPSRRYSNIAMILYCGEATAPLEWEDIDWDKAIIPMATDFNIANDGTFYSDRTWETRYNEMIFFGVDFDNLHEYTILVSGFSQQRIDLDWSIYFSIQDYATVG